MIHWFCECGHLETEHKLDPELQLEYCLKCACQMYTEREAELPDERDDNEDA